MSAPERLESRYRSQNRATVSTLPSHYLYPDSHPDEEKRFRPLMREGKRHPGGRSGAPSELMDALTWRLVGHAAND